VYTEHRDKNMRAIFPQEYMAIINMAAVEMFEVIPDNLILKKIALREILCLKR
jgi:hypothetical protein